MEIWVEGSVVRPALDVCFGVGLDVTCARPAAAERHRLTLRGPDETVALAVERLGGCGIEVFDADAGPVRAPSGIPEVKAAEAVAPVEDAPAVRGRRARRSGARQQV